MIEKIVHNCSAIKLFSSHCCPCQYATVAVPLILFNLSGSKSFKNPCCNWTFCLSFKAFKRKAVGPIQ